MLQAEHLDEGTLHAFLDGELDSDQLAEVERHLTDCAECRRNADETRSMLIEADELIERLDPPPFVMLPEGGSMGGGNRLEPVVLMPPEPETPRPGAGRPYRAAAAKRPKRPFAPPRAGRVAAMAAGLIVLLGGGWLLTRGDDPARDVQLARSEAPAQPTMSSFERDAAVGAEAPVGAGAPTPGAAADSATQPASGDTGAVAGASADARNEAASDDAVADEAPAEPAPEQLAARQRTAPPPSDPGPSPAQIAAARQAAAERAAEAAERDVAARTQAILEETAEEAAPPAAAAARPAAPDPMSALERRAGVYSRIGLDEARRMLGSPAHAILDLRPQFIGLASSSGVPGADQGRPLVRVVYLDPSQRLIILDQQRQSGDLPPSTDNMVVLARGGVRLWLHGGVPPATLRDLAGRVR